jgi:hypothetical protein
LLENVAPLSSDVIESAIRHIELPEDRRSSVQRAVCTTIYDTGMFEDFVKHSPKGMNILTLVGKAANSDCHSGDVIGAHLVEQSAVFENATVLLRYFLQLPEDFSFS